MKRSSSAEVKTPRVFHSMKRNILISAGFITGAALLFAADVKTDYSHSVDFGNYHTYSWLKVDAGNPLWATASNTTLMVN
jgi:hypothetical protein